MGNKETADNETQDLVTSDWEMGALHAESLDKKGAMDRHGGPVAQRRFHCQVVVVVMFVVQLELEGLS